MSVSFSHTVYTQLRLSTPSTSFRIRFASQLEDNILVPSRKFKRHLMITSHVLDFITTNCLASLITLAIPTALVELCCIPQTHI